MSLRNAYSAFFRIVSLHSAVSLGICAQARTEHVGGQLAAVASLLPPRGSWGLNSVDRLGGTGLHLWCHHLADPQAPHHTHWSPQDHTPSPVQVRNHCQLIVWAVPGLQRITTVTNACDNVCG